MRPVKLLSSAGTLLFLMLLMIRPADAQNLDKFFNKVNVGEWVELEGRAQPDGSLILKEIELVRGEMEDDDWEIKGEIRAVNSSEKMLYILTIPIKFDEKSEYEDDYNIIKSFSDLRKGMMVEMEGQYLKEGVFLVSEVGGSEVKKDEPNTMEIVGKISQIDPRTKSFIIMGVRAVFTPETRIKSPLY